MPSTVLITGANGFVGSWLARALVARGDRVRCLVRAGSDASALKGIAVEQVTGDVTQPESLAPALAGVSLVFHLAGIRRATQRAAFMHVNAEGTRLVAEAMLKAGAKRLVLCGSLAATGPSTGARPRVEDDPFSPSEWYGESKAEAERIAFTYSNRLEVTAIRPSRILGPGDHENLPFFKLVKRGFVLKLLGPDRRLSMVDVDDVVAQLLLQADLPQAVGQAFFCSSPEATTVEQMMRTIAKSLNLRVRTVPIPPWLLTALAQLADVVSNVTGRKLPLNRKLARQLLAPGWECSIEKAQRVLGYQPKRGLRESLERSAQSYFDLGWL